MRQIDSFFGTIAFGGAAAAIWLPFQLAVAPLVGTFAAAQIYLGATATLYAAALAPRAIRPGVAAIAGLASAALCFAVPNLAGTAAGLTAVVALSRSLLVKRSQPARALAVEAVVGAAALALASFLAQGPWLSFALAIWGFFLMQSLFFLAGTELRGSNTPAGVDPFDSAVREAFAILDAS
jgi:hypothetical protein